MDHRGAARLYGCTGCGRGVALLHGDAGEPRVAALQVLPGGVRHAERQEDRAAAGARYLRDATRRWLPEGAVQYPHRGPRECAQPSCGTPHGVACACVCARAVYRVLSSVRGGVGSRPSALVHALIPGSPALPGRCTAHPSSRCRCFTSRSCSRARTRRWRWRRLPSLASRSSPRRCPSRRPAPLRAPRGLRPADF